MSEPTDTPRMPGRGARLLRALATFAVFLLLGPFIGWLLTVAAMVLPAIPENLARDVPLSLVFGYAIGIIPAGVAGFIVAVRDILGRPVNLVMAAAIGGAIGVVWGLYMANEGSDYGFLGILVFISSIVTTVACWWVTRWLLHKEEIA